ncbi:hypothetical protein K504DRAFT_510840 [Pleomassaria siparia CBS 279.74]|uniref:MYND-type domain-containing protein n=1 Tax=Pleomassaria siparia CBS 279.74 TaxID=1314801 RepID=A0A6G1KRP2_9PLEO|nr:hypothetical protein K504DRAFT_510840 [Pleomassaria siparia CBS 279.74]
MAVNIFPEPFRLKDFQVFEPMVVDIKPALKPDSPPKCGNYGCNAPKMHQMCAGCHDIQYCNMDCVEQDFPSHRVICGAFHRGQRIPGRAYRRALYFPADMSRPSFIWLEHLNFKFGDDPNYMEVFLGSPPKSEVATMRFHDRTLPYEIHIFYVRDMSQTDIADIAENESVKTVLDTECVIRGSFIAVARSPFHETSQQVALNIDTKALGPIVAYLKLRAMYRGPIFFEQPQDMYPEVVYKKFMAHMQDSLTTVSTA